MFKLNCALQFRNIEIKQTARTKVWQIIGTIVYFVSVWVDGFAIMMILHLVLKIKLIS